MLHIFLHFLPIRPPCQPSISSFNPSKDLTNPKKGGKKIPQLGSLLIANEDVINFFFLLFP